MGQHRQGRREAKALSSSFKAAGTAATVTLTAPVVAAGKAAFGVASDYEGATSRIQAAFGLTREEAESFSEVGKSIYENGWGESLDEVNDALIQRRSTLRDVSDEDMSTVTTTAPHALRHLRRRRQRVHTRHERPHGGLRPVRDRGERPAHRGHAARPQLHRRARRQPVRVLRALGRGGHERERVLSLLEAGTSNGAYNLDKWATTSTSSSTALSNGRMEDSIGQFSEDTQQVFANFKAGGATAEDVLQAVLGDLTQMPSEYDKAALASTLWSSLARTTPWA